LIDEARGEEMTEDPDDRRELMIRAWYPAIIPEGAEPEPFLREIEPVHAIFARSLPLPAFTFSHLTRIPSHSYLDAPIAAGQPPFPVLVFSHGNSFYASQNSLLMEHLASHGYIVFSIDHPAQMAVWIPATDRSLLNTRRQ
jgi:predicted dienelactone hydrolase